MNKTENDRLKTEDLAQAAEYEAARRDERVVNRGDAEVRTGSAESLWDKTVKHEPAGSVVDHRAGDARAMKMDERERPPSANQTTTPANAAEVQLFRQEDTSELSRRWSDIQASFVDEPRHAVELADTLVAETMQRLAQMFASARKDLEGQWDRGEDVTTEDLRITLQRYRSFFDRLLAV